LTEVAGTFAEPARAAELDKLCAAAADVFTRAMVHALLAARALPGLPAYQDVWPVQ
jgi:L-aminopeptidase/D-esterase-like protein